MIERRPSADGVAAAMNRIAGDVILTPLLPLDWGGVRMWVKAECLQTGGSFKLRGATNRLSQLNEDERRRGVVAFSSGNHGQGVALAARRLGIPATIVMPSDAPQVKCDATRAAGAKIVFYERMRENRERISSDLAAETGATIVPSFDDVDVIEGQGTVGVEIGVQMEALGRRPRRIVAPCGGGGLSSGISLALPDAEMCIVEPQGWDDMCRSLASGAIHPVEQSAPPTRCDALQTPLVSPLTFAVLRDRRADAVAVSDEEVCVAMAFAAKALRLVVEPGGAVALAAVLAGKAGPLIDDMVVILSGGNVDPKVYSEILAAQAADGIR